MSKEHDAFLEREKMAEVLRLIGIPSRIDYFGASQPPKIEDLYDIIMDEEKLKVLVSKLRNKVFW